MNTLNSVKHLPQASWAEELRRRALEEMRIADPDACLAWFRAQNNFYAQKLAGLSKWEDAPVLEKAEVASIPVHSDETIHETRSSGTSGVQVSISSSVSERRFRQALAYRPFLFYALSDRPDDIVHQVIFVDGASIDDVHKQQWPFHFGGRTYLTWRVGIAAEPEAVLVLLQAVRPQVIRGLTSGIVRFTELADSSLDSLGVEVISPSGEELAPEWRALLIRAFAAPVLDRYGATEIGAIAWQCPYCDKYHANSDEIILEADSAGLLATPLFIESQPLLRYRLEDRVELHPPAYNCRVRLPTLTILSARRDDWLVDGAGRKISPLSFQFEQVPGLKSWRMHQLADGNLCLYVDAHEGELCTDTRQQLVDQVQTLVMGQSCQIIAGTHQLNLGGKYKRVVSEIVTRKWHD